MTGAHRMLAATRITTSAIVTPKVDSVTSLPTHAHLASAMVTLVLVPATKSKGSPTTTQTLILSMEYPLEMP
jgi:hypothetical protein